MGPLVHTYSILARDPDTGFLGGAVQSHWFNVGGTVLCGKAGVGIIATQSFVNPLFGPQGIGLLEQRKAANQVLDALLASDEQKELRQVCVLDAAGGVATFTGKRCIEAAGHLSGDQFSVQANLMESTSIWDAMAEGYRDARDKPFALRLLTALQAAQDAGGDLRGMQSAALLVLDKQPVKNPYEGRLIDLQVADHIDPLTELKRLYWIDQAYKHSAAAERLLSEKKDKAAMLEYEKARQSMPNNLELQFWYAIALLNMHREIKAIPVLQTIVSLEPNWLLVLSRIQSAGLLRISDDRLEVLKRRICK
ncbi:MAG: DUF1028 domain-containing protein [Myxococcota bacterium]|nr:DUF1028 domain-containing protein [Myxococcota bacterium]